MQPVQDLSIDTTVSATAISVHARQPGSARRCRPGRRQCWRGWPRSPEIVDVASDLQQNGRSADLDIDRPTAARFGITPATVDNALYDAFGQRIISTIFTQSNQYRVILDVDPAMQRSVSSLEFDLSALVGLDHRPGAASARSATLQIQPSPLQISHLKQFPVTTISFNLAPGASLGAAVDAINAALERTSNLPASFARRLSRAPRRRSNPRCRTKCSCCWPPSLTMYIVLGVLYESFIHPVTILSTLPSAGIGALLALMMAGRRPRRHRHHRHRAADRHRQEERDHDDRLRARRAAQRGQERRARRSTRPACCACARS